MVSVRQTLLVAIFAAEGLVQGQKVEAQTSQSTPAAKGSPYYNQAQKTRIHDQLINATPDADPVIKKVATDQVPKDALNWGDFNQLDTSPDEPHFTGSSILKDCQQVGASTITYQRGKDHYVLQKADLDHIQQGHAQLAQELKLPVKTETGFETVDQFICNDNIVDINNEKYLANDLSFTVLEHINMQNFDVIQAHEAKHGAQQAIEKDKTFTIKLITGEPAALTKQRTNEFDSDLFAEKKYGPDRVIAAIKSVDGYFNQLASDPNKPDPTLKKELEKTYGFGNDASGAHPSDGRRIQYMEAWKQFHDNGSFAMKPELPKPDAIWSIKPLNNNR